jgi:ferric-dicitrate binding protein FerR (iron transport regulator)
MTNERLQYLLQRYLDQQVTPEELEEFEQWYAGQQEGRAGLLDEADKEGVAAFSAPLLQTLHQQMAEANTAVQRPAARLLILRAIAVAATLIIAFTTGWYFWKTHARSPQQVSTRQGADSLPESRLLGLDNTSDTTCQYNLPDGTVLVLAAHSRVEYEQPFRNNKRDVYLKGKAFFKVAKDASRPFTVFSGDISTTALGTAFTITAYPQDQQVKVQLQEGKVVVRSVMPGTHKKIQDAYLLPGQELAYHVQTATADIRNLALVPHKPGINKVKVLSAGSRTSMEATFEQEPLEKVLQQLAKGYGVRLQYNRDDVAYMDFSGKINKQDSLAKVINRIALLHRLEVIKTPAGYRIRKNQ